MRAIKRIVIHCTATEDFEPCPAATIDEWHKERGWKGIGYHFVVQPDGTVEQGRPIDEQGAHVSGHNKDTIGIALAGGRDSKPDDAPTDHYSDRQLKAASKLVNALKLVLPNGGAITLHGHNEFANKACPGFRVSEWI
jgi:N-acetylmuramoyl-L-alanine amidase